MRNQKRAETVTSKKTDFDSKPVTRGKKGHHIMIKGSINQEDMHLNI